MLNFSYGLAEQVATFSHALTHAHGHTIDLFIMLKQVLKQYCIGFIIQLATRLGHMRMKMNGQVEPLNKGALSHPAPVSAASARVSEGWTDPEQQAVSVLSSAGSGGERGSTRDRGLHVRSDRVDEEGPGGEELSMIHEGESSFNKGDTSQHGSGRYQRIRSGGSFPRLPTADSGGMLHADSVASNLEGQEGSAPPSGRPSQRENFSGTLFKLGRGILGSMSKGGTKGRMSQADLDAAASPTAAEAAAAADANQQPRARGGSFGRVSGGLPPRVGGGSPFEKVRAAAEAGGSASSGRSSDVGGNLWGADSGGMVKREMSVATKLNLPPSLRMARGGGGGGGSSFGGSASSASTAASGTPAASGLSSMMGASAMSRPGQGGRTSSGPEGSGTSFSPLRGKAGGGGGGGGSGGRSWENTLQVLTAVTLTTPEGGPSQPQERTSPKGASAAAEPTRPERSRLSQTSQFRGLDGVDDSFLRKSRTASDYDLTGRQSSWSRQHSSMAKSIFSRGPAGGRGSDKSAPKARQAALPDDEEDEEEPGPSASAEGSTEEAGGGGGEPAYQWSEDSYMVVEPAAGSFSSVSAVGGGVPPGGASHSGFGSTPGGASQTGFDSTQGRKTSQQGFDSTPGGAGFDSADTSGGALLPTMSGLAQALLLSSQGGVEELSAAPGCRPPAVPLAVPNAAAARRPEGGSGSKGGTPLGEGVERNSGAEGGSRGGTSLGEGEERSASCSGEGEAPWMVEAAGSRRRGRPIAEGFLGPRPTVDTGRQGGSSSSLPPGRGPEVTSPRLSVSGAAPSFVTRVGGAGRLAVCCFVLY